MHPSTYYGRPTHDYRTSRFRLTESAYDGETRLPFHSHENAHFCLVLSGSYTERLGDREVRRRPGDLIYYAAGVAHAEAHQVAGRHFIIELAPELAEETESETPDWTARGCATRAAATRLFTELRRDPHAPPARVNEMIERLVERAAGREANRPIRGWLVGVEASLRATPWGPLDLERLAAEAGVHPVYLGRAFRQAYGCPPGEYLRRLRVERAQRALAGDAGLAHVAVDAGFCDQSHLNRVFKRQTGVTPGEYRRWVVAPA